MPIPFADTVNNGDVLNNYHVNQYGAPINSLVDGSNYYFSSGGGSNAYTVTVPSPNVVSALTEGMIFHFKANAANTGPATLQVNSLTPVDLVRSDGSALRSGDILTGTICRAIFDGAAFQLATPLGLAGTALFGSGADGNATISSNTTLAKDMDYLDLTVNTSISIDTAGFVIRVRGTLTLNGTIHCSGAAGQNGNAGSSGRAGGAGASAGSLGGGAPGGTGGNSNATGASGGAGDAGAAGGSGGAGTAAAGGSSSLINAAQVHWARAILGQSWVKPNLAGLLKGGAGGGGAGSSASQGGPGGGGGGGVVLVCALQVAGSGSVVASGGNGGAAGTSTDIGGGGGGGGGFVMVITADSSCSWTLTAAGGTGGTAAGGGSNGAAGSSGYTALLTNVSGV